MTFVAFTAYQERDGAWHGAYVVGGTSDVIIGGSVFDTPSTKIIWITSGFFTIYPYHLQWVIKGYTTPMNIAVVQFASDDIVTCSATTKEQQVVILKTYVTV